MRSEKLLCRFAQAAQKAALKAALGAALAAGVTAASAQSTAQQSSRLPGLRSLAPQSVGKPGPLAKSLAPLSEPLPPLDPLPTATASAPPSTAPNYGAPRRPVKLPRPYPPRRGPAPPPFTAAHPLPPLEPYRTSPQARLQNRALARASRAGLAAPQTPEYPPPPTVAVEPTIKAKPKPRVEERPYDPIGVGVGSLRLFPFVEASGGYDDNPNRLADDIRNKRPSAVIRGDAGLRVQSDWDQHSLQANLRGGYSEYLNFPEASRPDANGELTGRYDITRDTQLDLKGRVTLDTIRPGSPVITQGVPTVQAINRPITLGVNVSPGVTHRFNRLEVSLRGTFDRAIYNNVNFTDGSTLDFARTNYSGFGGGGRVSYELSPDLKPFVEGTYDRRVHDSVTDFNGFFRDSDGYSVRGGAQVNFTELLKGEASGGYAERTYDDPRLSKLRGPTIDASLIWTPSALTTVQLRGTTTLNETQLANASGALTRTISAQLSHDLLRNLNVSVLGSVYESDYQGTDVRERGWTAGVKLDYKVTRSVSLRGSYIHDRLDTTFVNADYTANTFLVGLRFQL